MSKYEEKIAQLRPLASEADVLAIFPPDHLAEHGGANAHGLYPFFGTPAHCSPDGLSTEDILEHFTISAPFSWRYDFYGFSIGMRLQSASSLIEKYGLVEPVRNKEFRRFKGTTPDQFEIEVCFVVKPVGEEVLRSISLYQINHSQIKAKRSAFNKQRGEAEYARIERANAWKKITDDDDAMLIDWAKQCKPWDNYSESEFVKYALWLLTATADERHMAAQCWNWGYGYAPLIWIYRQPDCDIATALHIFFGCNLQSYLKFEGNANQFERESGYASEAFQMMMDLKGRIDRGVYKRSELHFDVAKEMKYIEAYNPSTAQLAATLPSNLKLEYKGRRIVSENRFGGLRMPSLQID
jgi:Domain of unknown function (DUF4274)